MNNETKVLLGIGIATIAIIIGGVFFFGKNSEPKRLDNSVLVKDTSPSFGPKDAKVVIVEFSDFQCPACAVAAPTVKQIENEYKDKVVVYYRHLLIPKHKNAKISALAAEAANQQGKFWEMYTKLFEKQIDWESLDDPKSTFLGYAKDLGLDESEFTKDMESKTLSDKIDQDNANGIVLGINVTPTFFINGAKFEGALSYSQFKLEIEKELQK